MMRGKTWLGLGVVAVMIVAIGVTMGGTPSVAQADEPARLKVIPRDANAYGNSYGEWSAQWLQWAFSIPKATNPILDPTGANCAVGQSGPVWFLAGTSGGPAVVRHCTVPAGKALFFPILEAAFGAGIFDCEPTVPGVTCNLATLRMAAAESMDEVVLEASLDGKRLHDPYSYRVQSPAVMLTYPPANRFGVPEGLYEPNVADGYWLMLAPPRKGEHTLYFKAQVTGGPFAGASLEVTYHLTIGP